jgi:hypothetical protein
MMDVGRTGRNLVSPELSVVRTRVFDSRHLARYWVGVFDWWAKVDGTHGLHPCIGSGDD